MSVQETITLYSIQDLFPNLFQIKTKEANNYSPQKVNSPISDHTRLSSTPVNTSSTPTSTTQYHNIHYHDQIFDINCFHCTYNFGKQVRSRRRKCEIARYYSCTLPGCMKSYGSLSHLNTHVTTKGHGPKRLPEEFKNLRENLKGKAQHRHEKSKVPRQPRSQFP